MPEGGPGVLNDEVKIDILSYILQQNGFPSGASELKKDVSALEDIRMAKKGIWDGVFSAAQAERGRAALSQNGSIAWGRTERMRGRRVLGYCYPAVISSKRTCA